MRILGKFQNGDGFLPLASAWVFKSEQTIYCGLKILEKTECKKEKKISGIYL